MTTKNVGGRPRSTSERQKTHTVSVCLTAEDLRALDDFILRRQRASPEIVFSRSFLIRCLISEENRRTKEEST